MLRPRFLNKLMTKTRCKETLFAAKVAYEAEIKRRRMQVENWSDKREESAHQSGNKKLVNHIKDERKAFDEM